MPIATRTSRSSSSRRPRKVASRCRPSGRRYSSVEDLIAHYPYTIKPECPVLTLQQWCGLNNLSIEVHHRDPETVKAMGCKPIYVCIRGVEIEDGEDSDGYVLVSAVGNGSTDHQALANLAAQLSGKTVRFRMLSCSREVPVLTV